MHQRTRNVNTCPLARSLAPSALCVFSRARGLHLQENTQMLDLSLKDAKRFWSKVALSSVDECWHWTAGLTPAGYGWFYTTKPKMNHPAHRIAYFLAYRIQPGSLFVCHHCDVPTCCNPTHLFLGTHKDNMRDMRAKNRQNAGSEHHLAKLREPDIAIIRERLANRESLSSIASDYNVAKSQISRIKNGLQWKHM